jgi:DNA-binding PadR family transcriptional regulator
MDKIVLGLLMIKRLTVYEIRTIITKNFKEICSGSMGSIQAAIKKLLSAQMVTYEEYVEKSVNKKRYSITDKGRGAFSEWVQTPADFTGGTNMEIGKLLFMGLAPEGKRLALINNMIAILEKELSFLLGVQSKVKWSIQKDGAYDYLKNDDEYRTGIQNATQNADLYESIKNIGCFQHFTLEYSIDSLQFNIGWLHKLKEKVEGKTL